MALAERERKMIVFLVVAIVVVGIYWIKTELIPQYDELNSELSKVEDNVKQGRNKERNLPQLEYDVKVLQAKLSVLEKRLPQKDIGLKLLTKLEQLGKKVDVKFDKLAFGQEENAGLYKSLSIEMTPSELDGGGLHLQKVFLLLYALNNFENLLDLTTFNISVMDEKKERFQVRIVANVYMFKQEEFEKEFK